MVRIAVVNDDTTFLSLMSALLAERGWMMMEVRESGNAYTKLKEEQPDLVILDIRMGSPEAGWNILELLKLDPATSSIPVIVCSAALDDLRSREPWLAHHGIITLPKPFDIDDLYRRVEAALPQVD
jgi:DNA-binding response OmpR family regulator